MQRANGADEFDGSDSSREDNAEADSFCWYGEGDDRERHLKFVEDERVAKDRVGMESKHDEMRLA